MLPRATTRGSISISHHSWFHLYNLPLVDRSCGNIMLRTTICNAKWSFHIQTTICFLNTRFPTSHAIPVIANQVEPPNTSHNSYGHIEFLISPGHYPGSPCVDNPFRAKTHEWASTSLILKVIITSHVKLLISSTWPIQDQYTLNLGLRDSNASTNLPARGTTLQTSPLAIQPYGPPRS